MNGNPILGILPIKQNSQRVPGKNFRTFLGQPLFLHILATLVESTRLTRIVVDTDSEWLISYLNENWPQVEAIRRPDHLALGSTPMNDVLQNTLKAAGEDFFLQVHVTSPLLSVQTIDRAIDFFWQHWPDHDSLFSVTKKQERLWSKDCIPLNHDPAILLPTQDLAPIFVENSCLYLFNREVFTREVGRIGRAPILFTTPELESLDIDTEEDFKIAEALGLYLKRQPGEELHR